MHSWFSRRAKKLSVSVVRYEKVVAAAKTTKESCKKKYATAADKQQLHLRQNSRK